MGSQKPQTTTTSNAPWAGVAPYLSQSLSEAQKQYQSGQGYFQGNTTPGFSGQTQQALDLTQQRALNGSAVGNAAQANTTATLNGDFLNSNPNLQGAIDAASAGITRNYQNAVLPGITSQFNKGGRYGSGAQQGAVNDANATLASQLGNVASTMSYGNYNDERARQASAASLAPALAGMDYTNLQALTGVGQAYDAKAQADLTDRINQYNYANGGALDDYISRINGTGATRYSTSTSTQSGGGSSLFGTLAGLGLSAAGLGIDGYRAYKS